MPEPLNLRAATTSSLTVDADAGVIYGAAIITLGRTLPSAGDGSRMQVDRVTLQQVADAVNAGPCKVRMTHAELHADDDLPYRVGWIEKARVVGDKVVGDVHFYSPSDPDAARILAIAASDPGSFGLSISTNRFSIEPGDLLRVQGLSAVDLVGTPAANPAGLLSAKQGTNTMDFTAEQLAVLTDMGMAPDADAAAFYEGLDDEAKAKVDAAKKPEGDDAALPGTGDPTLAASGKPSGQNSLVLAERTRCLTIRGIAAKAGRDEAWITQCINSGASAEAAALSAINTLNREPHNMPTSTTTTTGGYDLNLNSIGPAVTDALALRLGARLKQAHPRHVEFAHRPLVETGRLWLGAMGVRNAMNMAPGQVADALLRSRTLALSQSTSDFPNILADALGKSLRNMYEEYPSTWGMWAGRRAHPDFKQIKVNQLHSLPTPILLPEGDETTYVSIGESKEVYELATYSIGTTLTRQAIINDDLSAFDRLPQMASGACRRLEDDLCYQVLTANANMGDNVALFATAHSNIGTGALTNANLSSGRKAMAKQTDAEGAVLNLRPSHLIVPVDIEDEARALVAATELRQKGSSDAEYTTNPYAFVSTLKVTSDPRLDADSEDQWYLASDPRVCDTVELCFLEGEETPVVMEEEDFDSDVKRFRVRHNVAGKAIDWRGL
ncbi:MAG: Mu-like prophage major head subunit gpT family protein, partial [Phycisphaerales bacterium JB063]